jgi:DNA-binding transcriptional MerR regulator
LDLIHSCQRSSGGYRLFEKGELNRLNLVVGLRKSGLPIKTITSLFSTPRRSRTAADAARSLNETFKEQATDVVKTAKVLRLLGSDLALSADILAGCFDCDRGFDELSCGECELFAAIPREGIPNALKALWPLRQGRPL